MMLDPVTVRMLAEERQRDFLNPQRAEANGPDLGQLVRRIGTNLAALGEQVRNLREAQAHPETTTVATEVRR